MYIAFCERTCKYSQVSGISYLISLGALLAKSHFVAPGKERIICIHIMTKVKFKVINKIMQKLILLGVH